ncbi:MAG: NAD(P)-binding domain-containing protein [Permianibacter sp.]
MTTTANANALINPNSPLPVAIIGAGPVGLAAAAHLVTRGFTPMILEAGASIAANLEGYRHVRLFSPWRYNLDKAAHALLASTGWQAPPAEQLPTAGDVIDHYLAPLAAHPAINSQLKLQHRVSQISRAATDKVKTRGREQAPFVIRAQTPTGEVELRAQAVIDASGTWSNPNPAGASGLPALGERALAARLRYGMPDVLGTLRGRYAGKRVLVLGAGHSAAGSLIALAELAEQEPATQLVWAIRGDNLTRIFGGGDKDGLPARGALGQRLKALRDSGRLELHTGFRVHSLQAGHSGLDVLDDAGNAIRAVDEIIVATGARPDLNTTRELRLKLDPWLESTELLAPLIDPNEHSCGTVRPHGHRELQHPEPGYYAVGARSYGRAPNFLLATGYEQVRSVVAALAGDFAAADDVQLDLPETGVCNVNFAGAEASEVNGAACCGSSDAASRTTAASAASCAVACAVSDGVNDDVSDGVRAAAAEASNAAPVTASKSATADAGCCGGPAPAASDACCVKDVVAKAAGQSGCGCSSDTGSDTGSDTDSNSGSGTGAATSENVNAKTAATFTNVTRVAPAAASCCG